MVSVSQSVLLRSIFAGISRPLDFECWHRATIRPWEGRFPRHRSHCFVDMLAHHYYSKLADQPLPIDIHCSFQLDGHFRLQLIFALHRHLDWNFFIIVPLSTVGAVLPTRGR